MRLSDKYDADLSGLHAICSVDQLGYWPAHIFCVRRRKLNDTMQGTGGGYDISNHKVIIGMGIQDRSERRSNNILGAHFRLTEAACFNNLQPKGN